MWSSSTATEQAQHSVPYLIISILPARSVTLVTWKAPYVRDHGCFQIFWESTARIEVSNSANWEGAGATRYSIPSAKRGRDATTRIVPLRAFPFTELLPQLGTLTSSVGPPRLLSLSISRRHTWKSRKSTENLAFLPRLSLVVRTRNVLPIKALPPNPLRVPDFFSFSSNISYSPSWSAGTRLLGSILTSILLGGLSRQSFWSLTCLRSILFTAVNMKLVTLFAGLPAVAVALSRGYRNSQPCKQLALGRHAARCNDVSLVKQPRQVGAVAPGTVTRSAGVAVVTVTVIVADESQPDATISELSSGQYQRPFWEARSQLTSSLDSRLNCSHASSTSTRPR